MTNPYTPPSDLTGDRASEPVECDEFNSGLWLVFANVLLIATLASLLAWTVIYGIFESAVVIGTWTLLLGLQLPLLLRRPRNGTALETRDSN